MEGDSYVSCIKINGVPILPPLMTKGIKEEMFNYKQIAIRVEKKLATLRVAREQSKEIDADIVQKNCRNILNNSREDPFFLDRNKCQNEMITNGFSPELLKDFNDGLKKGSQWNGETNVDHMPEYQISLASDACLRSGVVPPKENTDQHAKKISSTNSTTIETVSNDWKPQVPTTLNIIPMTLNKPDRIEDEIYNKSDLHDAEDTPKLVRQGSYVLDTPSPVLLAHMQMEHKTVAKPYTEYVPTPCTNKGHRKEWNISQAKIEWENDCRSKSFVHAVPTESFELSPDKTRTSDSKVGQRMHKSVSSLTIPAPSFTAYPATRSVDCIQTMLANECIEKRNIEANRDRKYANSDEKRQDFQGSRKNDNFSTFQLAHKRGNVPERAASSDSGVPFSNNLVLEHNRVPINDNCEEELSRNTETEDFASKLKLSVTSDKLLTVYKKVQEMHKNQMTELVTRQQREQTLLQEEFEKQQLLLLTEIRKSFPEISVSLLSENILPASFNQAALDSRKFSTDIGSNMETVKNLKSNVQDERKADDSRNDNEKLTPCPLDNTYSEISLPAMEPCFMGKEEVKAELQPDKDRSYEKILVKDGGGCKRLNVSRQLFPLDSKTVHIPILDRTVYGSKHIEAVNLINAYARGYLVRRMMRTERVIALKNTYREALHCMLKLHVDAPLNRSESNFLFRLQLQCDAASMNIVELFANKPEKRMQVIAQDREIKQSRAERPTSARSYSFATQRTLARKKLKEIEEHHPSSFARSCLSRSRCQTWTSDDKEKILSPNILYHDIKRSTSAGTVRKPWR
ncbi:uncharacterized protein LOC143212171 isoform X2 [Lasioglossum baleicum]|uniref:uncharacterized protein LOC143212171 isoform X2 n=1 Tax=Lasioglossum baleicum TaxID=434251 RepID=UPI003FCC8856